MKKKANELPFKVHSPAEELEREDLSPPPLISPTLSVGVPVVCVARGVEETLKFSARVGDTATNRDDTIVLVGETEGEAPRERVPVGVQDVVGEGV